MKTALFLCAALLLSSFCRADDSGTKYYVGLQAGTGLLNPFYSQGVGIEAGKAWSDGLRSGFLIEDDHRQDYITWNRYYEFALTEGYLIPVGNSFSFGVDIAAGPVLDYYFGASDFRVGRFIEELTPSA